MVDEKIDQDSSELDKSYKYGDIDVKTELKAAFWGQEDDMILSYLSRVPNKRGAIMAHLALYFVHDYLLLSPRRLRSKLKNLINLGLIRTHKEAGLIFYQIVPQKKEK